MGALWSKCSDDSAAEPAGAPPPAPDQPCPWASNLKSASEEFGYDFEAVHGISYPPFIREQAVDHLRANFKSAPGDIFINTFPKCGTTWLQQIVLLLLHDGDAGQVKPHPALQTQAPWLEACYQRPKERAGPRPYLDDAGLAALSADPCRAPAGRRVFKTHAPRQLFPVDDARLDPGTRIIYVARNPKDTLVSHFNHSVAIPAHRYSGGWEHWFELWMGGGAESGSWFDHNLGWWQAKQGSIGEQILWLNFEDLKSDPPAKIAEIARFLGIAPVPELVERVAIASGFDVMKAKTEAAAAATAGGGSAEASSRFRSGGAGGWRKQFTDAQSAEVDRVYRERVRAEAPSLKFDFGDGAQV